MTDNELTPKQQATDLVYRAKYAGYTVTRLAKRAIIDRTTIYGWLRGDFEPQFDKLNRLKAVVKEIEAERAERTCTKCGNVSDA